MDFLEQIGAYFPVNQQERKDKSLIYRYIQDYPHNVHTRENGMAHLTASGFIMNRALTRVLVIYHKVYQAWGWTGGHTDGQRDLLSVAIKEAKEETGLTHLEPLSEGILSLDILPVWGHMKKGEYVSAHLHLNAAYVLIADEEAPLTVNTEETDGVKWIDADSIAQHADEPDLVVVYEKLIKAARNYQEPKVPGHGQTVPPKEDRGLKQVLSDTAVPIALHEAKSAYYKAKLVKEVTFMTGKAIAKGAKGLWSSKK